LNGLGLCAGIGGLELGLQVFGHRPLLFVERDEFCQLVLRKHWPDVPIWDDVSTFPANDWRGSIDAVTAGFPCQPWSIAGSQRGLDDERWLWPDIARIVRDVRPGVVFLENVPMLRRGGLEKVLYDLASVGFDAEWDLFRASDVGAPHERERIFILAYSNRHRLEAIMGDVRRWLRDFAESDHRLGSWPPGPEDAAGWEATLEERLHPLHRVADGLPNHVDRSYSLGNAVVPMQASLAFAILAKRAVK